MADAWEEWNVVSMRDPVSLVGPARDLHALGWMRTELNNGGFDQLFFNSAGDVLPQAETAARAAGWVELADLVRRAMSVLGDPYPSDCTDRRAVLLDLGEPERLQLEELDDAYYELEASSDLDALMRAMVRR